MSEDHAKQAAKLTIAERVAVLWLPADGALRHRPPRRRGQPQHTTMLRLCFTHRLACMDGSGMWRLNHDGRAVRALLTEGAP